MQEGDDSYIESTDAYSENSVSVGNDDQKADKVKQSVVETVSPRHALHHPEPFLRDPPQRGCKQHWLTCPAPLPAYHSNQM